MRRFLLILFTLIASISVWADSISIPDEQLILNLYEELVISSGTEDEDLYNRLLDLYENPINLNQATYDDLIRLCPLLTQQQVDELLIYRDKHPFHSTAELPLAIHLQPYELRNLQLFLTAGAEAEPSMRARDVFEYAHHEFIWRLDTRNLEGYKGDPVFGQFRYRFDYLNRVRWGVNFRRQPGVGADGLEYSAYVQLDHLGPVKTLVAGSYQAHFGLGLVFAESFHMGRSAYVLASGGESEGLRRYTSTDHNSFHGAGATFSIPTDKRHLQLLLTALYSFTLPNDSLQRHSIGANFTCRYDRLKVGISYLQNIYTDTLRYYYEHAAYNQHYFRGTHQAIIGADFRYNLGIVDVFGELAAAENTHWGLATTFGVRSEPVRDVGLMLSARYYSPWFDNDRGYAQGQSSRPNDEHGLYLGVEVKRVPALRLSAYGDVFWFSGIKYGGPKSSSWGYEAMAEAQYLPMRTAYDMRLRIKAREKFSTSTYALRYQYNHHLRNWQLRTQLDANLVKDSLSSSRPTYGVSLYQDVEYRFCYRTDEFVIQARLQGFYAPEWGNRIYTCEHDVLHSFSIPAVYGAGIRTYLNFRVALPLNTNMHSGRSLNDKLSIYFRISETLDWIAKAKDAARFHRTDLHLLLVYQF